jgi:DNA N-6-adenine-methyltransferase (Dam)
VSRKMPAQRPGSSEQDVRTPPEFLAAVVKRLGPIAWDVAATKENAVAARFLGPGSPHAENALAASWTSLGRALVPKVEAAHAPRGLADWLPIEPAPILWLNPPYGDIRPWAERASLSRDRGLRLAMLVPASVGANWFSDFVHERARVLALHPKLTFVGHKAAYPKDLILCVYGETPGFECWRWK